jgi:uncharacterized membrane protein
MSQLVPVFLTIHVLTAIVAFGPTFAFPLIARMAANEPQHGLFALHLTEKIETRMTLPLALTMPISGGLLVWSEGIDLADAHWLIAAILLYVIAIGYAFVFQMRTLNRMIEIATGMAARMAPAPAGAPVLAEGPGAALAVDAALPAAARTGGPKLEPAAEMKMLGNRVARGGIFLTVLIILIVSLMAGKPAI